VKDQIYQIRVKGHLDHEWAEWFEELTITHESDGTTTLYGPLPDQTALHTVLVRIRDMNLPLISVNQAAGVTPGQIENRSEE
jgi:hypothetical protein